MRRCAQTLEPEMSQNEQEFLIDLLLSEQKPGRHLEVGTAAGGTLVSMIQSFPREARPEFVVVDRMTYFPQQEEIIYRNLRKNSIDPQCIQFRKTTSTQAFRHAEIRDERFDFVLIDASHKIFSVTADLRWTRLLSPGGIVCFHDYGPKFPGVRLAVDRFLRRNSAYERAGQAGTLLAIRKISNSQSKEVTTSDRIHSLAWYIPLEMDRRRRKRLQKYFAFT